MIQKISKLFLPANLEIEIHTSTTFSITTMQAFC